MARIDRAALRQKIQELAGLSDDERAALLQLAAEGRSYGLVWENRAEEVEERLRDELPVLVEDASLRITGQDTEHELPRMDHELEDNNSRGNNGNSRGNESPNHILIEGDNLEALTTLSYTHEGKVDVIYIDPPYNTGNKDFVYNDSFVDSEDSYRHSKWLSFMSKRLRIAKRLLSDRGVIFISIDDNEQANLRLLLEEIFNGKALDRGTLIWENKGSTKGFSKIVKNHEYILAFSKNPDSIKSLFNKNFPADDDLIEERLQIKRSPKNPLCQIKFPKGLPIRDVSDVIFEGSVGNGTNRIDIVSGKMIFKGGLLQNDVILEASFPYRNQTEKFFSAIETGEPVYDTKGQQWLEVYFSKTGVPHYSKQRGFTILSSLLDDVPNSGFSDLKALGLETKFSNPKPVGLIYRLLSHFSTDNYTILDFFAGSGTTLHAVMQLNKEDGGKRQCILVTNNENNICREVTYERNKRVICGYTTPKGVQVEGLHENNLRYYRTRLLPRERTNKNMRALVNAATDLLCIKEGLYEEWKVESGKWKVGMTQKDFRVFSDSGRAMMVVYNEESIPDIVDWLQTDANVYSLFTNHSSPIKVYVFSPGAYAWDDDFAPVLDRVELCALPEAIYQAYKNVLPKKRRPGSVTSEAEKGGEE